MVADDFRAGEALALEWIEGRTSLTDDLAVIVLGMARELSGEAREFGGDARGFLVTIGNAARMAKRDDLPTLARTSAPRAKGLANAQPTAPEPPPAPTTDINEMFRRRRERERAVRLEELGRRNQEAFMEQQHAFTLGNPMRNDADWRGW